MHDLTKHKLFSFIYQERKPWVAFLSSIILMLALILVVIQFNVPNPNMILIAGLVVCSALFGYTGGIIAGVIMFIYTVYFFSTDNSFFSFTDQNMKKVFISFIGIIVDMVFVCELKRASTAAFREIKSLTATLQEDNRLLQQISLTDALTGCRNRLSLRHDFPDYIERELFTMMLDVDDFKSINDQYGHDKGDIALEQTGKLLINTFGANHCYRYGGDEFLVICPGIELDEFHRKAESLMGNRPVIDVGNDTIQVSYSIGYSQGKPNDESTLRNMLILADNRLYQAKRRGKNEIVGARCQ
jgi:diguanylate cyclase (GGDEF)-like protein